ncbi:MAG: hypothetical protein AB7V43_12905 [Acidimicrobiia bacterium]
MASWYWCLEHNTVEPDTTGCPLDRRLGPYESAEAARNWKQRRDARNESWDEADKDWYGDDEQDDEPKR